MYLSCSTNCMWSLVWMKCGTFHVCYSGETFSLNRSCFIRNALKFTMKIYSRIIFMLQDTIKKYPWNYIVYTKVYYWEHDFWMLTNLLSMVMLTATPLVCYAIYHLWKKLPVWQHLEWTDELDLYIKTLKRTTYRSLLRLMVVGEHAAPNEQHNQQPLNTSGK